MTTLTNATAKTESGARTETSGLAAIMICAFLGAGLLFTAGFANATALHGAAHDTRHSISFPCH